MKHLPAFRKRPLTTLFPDESQSVAVRATYPGQLILFASITLICGEDYTVSPTFLFRPSTVFDAIFSNTEIKIMEFLFPRRCRFPDTLVTISDRSFLTLLDQVHVVSMELS
jgi:hypothetical protein